MHALLFVSPIDLSSIGADGGRGGRQPEGIDTDVPSAERANARSGMRGPTRLGVVRPTSVVVTLTMTIDPPRWLPASDAARYAHVVRHHVTSAALPRGERTTIRSWIGVTRMWRTDKWYSRFCVSTSTVALLSPAGTPQGGGNTHRHDP